MEPVPRRETTEPAAHGLIPKIEPVAVHGERKRDFSREFTSSRGDTLLPPGTVSMENHPRGQGLTGRRRRRWLPPVSCVSTRNGFPYSESSHPHRPPPRGGGRVNGDWPWIAVPGVKHDLIECQVRSRTDGLLPTISPGYPFRRSPISASRRKWRLAETPAPPAPVLGGCAAMPPRIRPRRCL